MRRFVFHVDQMPAWAFIATAVLAFGGARAGRLFALMHQNRGGMELGGIVTLGIFVLLVISAVRRRHVEAWRSTIHVMGSLVAGNAFGVVLVWPFIPEGYDIPLAPLLRDTLAAGAWMAILSLPLGIGMLWLSRKYGTHSAVTERRSRAPTEGRPSANPSFPPRTP